MVGFGENPNGKREIAMSLPPPTHAATNSADVICVLRLLLDKTLKLSRSQLCRKIPTFAYPRATFGLLPPILKCLVFFTQQPISP